MESKKPWKQCLSYGCGELIRDGAYCVKHKDERVKQYDKYERNKESRMFYQSSNWKKVRQYVKARDGNLCQLCLKDKRFTQADVCDHYIPLEFDKSKGLDPSNLWMLCHGCHNQKTVDDRKKYSNNR
ncbi:5-methylcytosine-specific restriction protein A [Virgibacillus halotolerans]|uniref:HNH endonuclease n=1 Tax=Virgibacillus halotolerans TaxID=1071053 RepID=UPI0019603CA4|nr:HNH endonuclease [Virgibacillus halotolerans]MBM7598483.1 5-methylcytosine-specific restriction protein A [Virgibacillus halotolerans]